MLITVSNILNLNLMNSVDDDSPFVFQENHAGRDTAAL